MGRSSNQLQSATVSPGGHRQLFSSFSPSVRKDSRPQVVPGDHRLFSHVGRGVDQESNKSPYMHQHSMGSSDKQSVSSGGFAGDMKFLQNFKTQRITKKQLKFITKRTKEIEREGHRKREDLQRSQIKFKLKDAMKRKIKLTENIIDERKRKAGGESSSESYDCDKHDIDRKKELSGIFSVTTPLFLQIIEKIKRENQYIGDIQDFFYKIKRQKLRDIDDEQAILRMESMIDQKTLDRFYEYNQMMQRLGIYDLSPQPRLPTTGSSRGSYRMMPMVNNSQKDLQPKKLDLFNLKVHDEDLDSELIGEMFSNTQMSKPQEPQPASKGSTRSNKFKRRQTTTQQELYFSQKISTTHLNTNILIQEENVDNQPKASNIPQLNLKRVQPNSMRRITFNVEFKDEEEDEKKSEPADQGEPEPAPRPPPNAHPRSQRKASRLKNILEKGPSKEHVKTHESLERSKEKIIFPKKQLNIDTSNSAERRPTIRDKATASHSSVLEQLTMPLTTENRSKEDRGKRPTGFQSGADQRIKKFRHNEFLKQKKVALVKLQQLKQRECFNKERQMTQQRLSTREDYPLEPNRIISQRGPSYSKLDPIDHPALHTAEEKIREEAEDLMMNFRHISTNLSNYQRKKDPQPSSHIKLHGLSSESPARLDTARSSRMQFKMAPISKNLSKEQASCQDIIKSLTDLFSSQKSKGTLLTGRSSHQARSKILASQANNIPTTESIQEESKSPASARSPRKHSEQSQFNLPIIEQPAAASRQQVIFESNPTQTDHTKESSDSHFQRQLKLMERYEEEVEKHRLEKNKQQAHKNQSFTERLAEQKINYQIQRINNQLREYFIKKFRQYNQKLKKKQEKDKQNFQKLSLYAQQRKLKKEENDRKVQEQKTKKEEQERPLDFGLPPGIELDPYKKERKGRLGEKKHPKNPHLEKFIEELTERKKKERDESEAQIKEYLEERKRNLQIFKSARDPYKEDGDKVDFQNMVAVNLTRDVNHKEYENACRDLRKKDELNPRYFVGESHLERTLKKQEFERLQGQMDTNSRKHKAHTSRRLEKLINIQEYLKNEKKAGNLEYTQKDLKDLMANDTVPYVDENEKYNREIRIQMIERGKDDDEVNLMSPLQGFKKYFEEADRQRETDGMKFQARIDKRWAVQKHLAYQSSKFMKRSKMMKYKKE